MSTWVAIELDGMTILETQNHINQWYFRKSDRLILPPPGDDSDNGPRFVYKASAKTVARRLAFDGNDLGLLKQDFKEQLAFMVHDCKQMLEIIPHGKCAQLLPVLEDSTLDEWLSLLRRIKKDELKPSWWNNSPDVCDDVLLNFMLSDFDEYYLSERPGGGYFHFPCTSEEMYAVAVLQVVPEDSYFLLDATAIIHSGWSDDFDDVIEFHQDNTTFYEIFKSSLTETLGLAVLAPNSDSLARMLYANVITLLETYLSDTLRKQILKRNAVLRRFVKNHDAFKNSRKEPISEVFETYDRINELANEAINGLSFHNILTAKKLYKEVLATSFPDDISELVKAVDTRHDIVHRNGKDFHRNAVIVTMAKVQVVAELVDETVKYIDKQIKDGLLEDDNPGVDISS